MVKIQQYLTVHRKLLVALMTVLIVVAELLKFSGYSLLGYQLCMAVTGIIGVIPILLTAISALQVRLVSIDVLVSIAVVGAFIIGEYNEAAIVTWLFIGGEVLEDLTLQKTRSAVQQLGEMAPQTAVVIDKNGHHHEEDVDFLDPGTRVLVKTGNQVPVDGEVLTGTALLNEASITGEARLVSKHAGDEVFAGTILADGAITVQTTAVGEDTTFGKIIELVEEAQDSKTRTQRFIDHFAKYYTPFVLLIALVVGLVTHSFRLAITVMVLGCPGALVIGVPASTVAGIGNGARQGILFKGSDVMDRIRHVDTIAFDKTGTLTEGRPSVQTVMVLRGDRQSIIDHAVSIEQQSDHPLAQAITQLTVRHSFHANNIKVIQGQGIRGQVDGDDYLLGNLDFVRDQLSVSDAVHQATIQLTQSGNSVVILANTEKTELALFAIQDQVRPQAASTLERLKQCGVQRLIMLTGDNEGSAKQIAAALPIDEVHASMLPAGKAQFIKDQRQQGHHVAFVGDGINDSPALSAADVAIAMGSGTDVAMDVADVVLVKSNLTTLFSAVQLAKQTIFNMNQNIVIALLTVAFLFVGLFAGYIEMASGMLIHELSILVVILNSMRLLKYSAKLDHHQFLHSKIRIESKA